MISNVTFACDDHKSDVTLVCDDHSSDVTFACDDNKIDVTLVSFESQHYQLNDYQCSENPNFWFHPSDSWNLSIEPFS